MIKTLQSLRGLMALLIIVYHCYSGHGAYVDTLTPCAVSCFFMLSGFLMMLHHPVEKLGQFPYGRFMRRRLVKIYPLHVLLTLVMVPSFGVNWKLGVHLALLQSWFPAVGVHFGYNYVSWFVSSMLLCYVLYPLLGWVLGHLRVRWGVLLCAAVASALLIWSATMPVKSHNYLFYVFPPLRLLDFAAGMVAARCWTTYGGRLSARAAWLSALAAATVILVLGTFPHSQGVTHAAYFAIVWMLPLGVLFVALCAIEHHQAAGVLSWRPLVWLGGIGLELYLLQGVVSAVATKLGLLVMGYRLSPEAHIVLVFLLIIPAAWLVHRYFTIPLARKLGNN